MRASLVVVAGVLTVTFGYAVPAFGDEVRDGQWHLEQLRVAEAHEHSLGDGVTVAVLDTGVDASHPDLRGNVLPGVDLTGRGGRGGRGGEDSDGRDDPAGTGTALAGLIAGHGHGTGGDDGVLGLAPRAAIVPVVIAAPGAAPDAATVAAGIDEAVRLGAGVICVGRPVPDDPAVTRAAGAAVAAGAVVVMPAMPAGDLLARYGGVGVLGAVPVASGEPAPAPAPGALAVPGVHVLSTGGQGGYFLHARTSGPAATAVLAGAAALVRAAYPVLAAHAVTHRLAVTADEGGLNLPAALTATVGTPPASPPAPPPTGSPATPTPTATPGRPPAATEPVAAFDSDDWRRWLVGAPLVGFLGLLTAASLAAARRARRSPR